MCSTIPEGEDRTRIDASYCMYCTDVAVIFFFSKQHVFARDITPYSVFTPIYSSTN